MKIGVIGYGNIGSLIVNNILKLDLLFDDEKLMISNRHIRKLDELKEEYKDMDFEITKDNTEIAKNCEKIIIAVETPEFKKVMEEILPHINKNTHIIYTCAGLSFKHIESFYKGKLSLIIPTIASTATMNNSISSLRRRRGITLIKHNSQVDIEEKFFIEDLFNEFSNVKVLNNQINTEENNTYGEENKLEVCTIIASCGPAFIATIIDEVSEITSRLSDIKKEEAEFMILKTIIGTALLKDDESISNEELINRVATKKGITQEGIELIQGETSKTTRKLIYHLLDKYSDVKTELDKEYLE